MQVVIRRGVVVAGGLVGAALGWLVGAVLAPDLAAVTATVGAFAGVVLAGLALAMREYDEESEAGANGVEESNDVGESDAETASDEAP